MLEADCWCILRTGSSRTLPLARSLTKAGFEVWTPVRTIKRPVSGQRRRLVLGQRREMIEVDLPILPGFVFARAGQINDLARVGSMTFSPHPDFSIFSWNGRAPLVSEAQIAGLRRAHDDAATAIMSERDAENRETARHERAMRLGSERARRKALRQERKDLPPGEAVTVNGISALAGLIGTVIKGNGASAVIDFGGTLTMTIEAWRVLPIAIGTIPALMGTAA